MSWPFRKLVTAFRGRYMRASSISREGLNLAPFSIGFDLKRIVSPGPGGTTVDGSGGGREKSGASGDYPRLLPAGSMKFTVELGATSFFNVYRLAEGWGTHLFR